MLSSSLDQLDDIKPEFNHFLSFITLQHNPPEIQKILLQKLLSKLNVGHGYAFFQTVTFIKTSPTNSNSDLINHSKPSFNTYALPIREILSIVTQLDCEIQELYRDDFQLDPDFHSYSFFIRRKVIAK